MLTLGKQRKASFLAFSMHTAALIIFISGVFLLFADQSLRSSVIRIIGLAAYMALLVVLYFSFRLKKNGITLLLLATLGAQGVISMISNAAFGFQSTFFADPSTYNELIAFITHFNVHSVALSVLVFCAYFLLIVFSAVLAVSSYLLSKNLKYLKMMKFNWIEEAPFGEDI